MSLIVEVTTDLAACHAIRRAVFIDEQGVSDDEEWDDLDRDAIHLLIRDDTRAAATARLLKDDAQTGRIGRICVMPEWRGRGLGADLVRFGLEYFQANGMRRVVLGAQVQAEEFYRKLGFEPFGPVYDDAGIPHRDMRHVF